MPEPDHLLDALLDRALDARRPPDPRAGLEERVLATLRSAPPRAHGPALAGWLRPLAAGLAFGVLALVLVRTRQVGSPAADGPAAPRAPARTAAPLPPPSPASPGAPVPAPLAKQAPGPETAAARSRPIVPPRRSRTVRPATFPVASPLGEQERLLLRYVTGTPREELAARAGFLDDPVTLPSIDDTTSSP